MFHLGSTYPVTQTWQRQLRWVPGQLIRSENYVWPLKKIFKISVQLQTKLGENNWKSQMMHPNMNTHKHTAQLRKQWSFILEKKRKENKISFLENVNSNRNLVQWKWIGTIRIRWTTKETEMIKWAERIVVQRCISVRQCIQSSKVGKYVKDLKGLHLELLVDF